MSERILSEADLRSCVGIDESGLAAVEEAFVWLADGRAEMPPVLHLHLDDRDGEVDVKTAYVRGRDRFALKVASGFWGNARLGLPTGNALMVVLSAVTGACEAVLLDRGYLTDLRTGLAGAVAARHLAPAEVRDAGVLGTGAQARFQMRSLHLVRPFQRLWVHGRSREKAESYAAEMARELGVEARIADAEEVVRRSQCVVTTTPAREPLIEADWLHPGLHVTAMGSDVAGKNEIAAAALERADLLACDRRSQAFAIGELQHVDRPTHEDSVVELGEVISGRRAGRTTADEITVADLTGTGVQDTAIALQALAEAERRGLGHRMPAA